MKTIAAISTAPAPSGIGVIRLSGDDALCVADKVFTAFNSQKKLSEMKGYTAAFGFVHDKNGEKRDDCVALVFRAPHSYTGENVAELSCHGGLFVLKKVLEDCFEAGAVPAEAGEFTKRAFLNKKIDLTEAEAVAAIISAQSEASAKAAVSAKDGALNKKIKQNLEKLLSLSAHLSAWTDYPDDDIDEIDSAHMKDSVCAVKNDLQELLKTYDVTRNVSEGIDTAIVGRTNVGKSTLMNFLCGEDKSIVTDVEGTTRDVVESTVRLGNVLLKLSDTAGLRESDDEIENIGIELSKKKLNSAGLIFAVFDCTKPLNDEDLNLCEAIKMRPAILLINKTDLSAVWRSDILNKFGLPVINISAADGKGYEEIVKQTEKILGTDSFNPYAPLLATQRQKNCCDRAIKALNDAENALLSGFTLDAANVCVDDALNALLELTGEKASERVTKEIFKRFCVGK